MQVRLGDGHDEGLFSLIKVKSYIDCHLLKLLEPQCPVSMSLSSLRETKDYDIRTGIRHI